MRTDFSVFTRCEPPQAQIAADNSNRLQWRANWVKLLAYKKLVRVHKGKSGQAMNANLGLSARLKEFRRAVADVVYYGARQHYKYAPKPYMIAGISGYIDGTKRFDHFSIDLLECTPPKRRLEVFRSFWGLRVSNLKNYRRLRKPNPMHVELGLRDGQYVSPILTNARRFRVFAEPNQILKLQKERIMQVIYTEKRPRVPAEHVGIEIECLSKLPSNKLGDALRDAGLARFIHLKDDGSLRTQGEYGFTHELALCVPVVKVAEVVRETCKVLRQSCAINQSCGLHVHLDMREYQSRYDAGFNRVFANLVSCNGVFQRMLPASRRSNVFCARNRDKKFSNAVRTTTRYWMVNPHAYEAHKTLEVRCHSGTINPDKIIHWVNFLLAIKAHQSELSYVRGVKQLAKTLGLPADLTSYLEARTKKFKDTQAQEESPPVGSIADARLSREERARRQAEFDNENGCVCDDPDCPECYPENTLVRISNSTTDIPF